MSETKIRLTVFFEDPFWAGVFEREEDGELTAARVVFGAEPRDAEVYGLVLERWSRLRFSPAVPVGREARKASKALRRDAVRTMREKGVGTRSQQALKLQQEQRGTERRQRTSLEKETQKQRKFEQKQQKKKEKHRGR